MTMPTVQFQIGETVWVAQVRTRKCMVTCPVCAGKGKVTVILGDGEHVTIECGYCSIGYGEPQLEVMSEYCEGLDAVLKEVSGIEIGKGVEYHCDCNIYQAKDVFRTREEALRRAEVLLKERQVLEEERLNKAKTNDLKTYAWHVGYYRKQIEVTRRQIERWEKKLCVCKEKAKVS